MVAEDQNPRIVYIPEVGWQDSIITALQGTSKVWRMFQPTL